MSPAIHPCLAMDGAALSWHGRFEADPPPECPLARSIHLADDGWDLKECKEDYTPHPA